MENYSGGIKNVRTKKLLANAIMELAETVPVSKIKIKDICKKCGFKRESFYYHFKDKYELVAWTFLQEFYTALNTTENLNSVEMMSDILKKMEVNRNFYKSALLDTSQNNLREYMLDMYVNMEEQALIKYLGTDPIDSDLLYEIKCFSFACIMHTEEWITGKDKMTPEIFAERMYHGMPDILKTAFKLNNI